MSFDLPSIDELKRTAECGQRITPEDVSVISQAESELTGAGPISGGPAGQSSQAGGKHRSKYGWSDG